MAHMWVSQNQGYLFRGVHMISKDESSLGCILGHIEVPLLREITIYTVQGDYLMDL